MAIRYLGDSNIEDIYRIYVQALEAEELEVTKAANIHNLLSKTRESKEMDFDLKTCDRLPDGDAGKTHDG